MKKEAAFLAAMGLTVLVLGAKQRSLIGLACALAGGGMLVYSAVSTASSSDRPRASGFDEVDEASWESFPASDPPAWT